MGDGPDVYTARELAQAVGVSVRHVEALMATGELPAIDGVYVPHGAAVAWGRRFVQARGLPSAIAGVAAEPSGSAAPTTQELPLFQFCSSDPRQAGMPAAVSAAAHLLAAAVAILVATTNVGTSAAARIEGHIPNPMRLVYLALPGPGGGGGGGGLKQPQPPPAAKREGSRALSSPLPEREPPPPVEPPDVDSPPPPTEELPPLNVPVAKSPSDDEDRPGTLEQTTEASDSRGAGENGGVGTGQGTGIGEGQGAGVGPGSGGGMGGGPYRPGSGIAPPSLLREVKPVYTDEARRRNVTGDVVLEIVVRADGTVGEVRLLEGLGSGLDQRAVEAVRQWRFSPARRLGQAVDVLVEVAVEFRLR